MTADELIEALSEWPTDDRPVVVQVDGDYLLVTEVEPHDDAIVLRWGPR